MILIGTCGYFYDDWKGTFYPPGLPKSDWLAFYAGRFQALELNSSYYAIPSQPLIRTLVENTPAGFQVVVKAYRGITHERAGSPGEMQAGFQEAIAPLVESGKLAAVLYQFPQSFRYDSRNMELVGGIIEAGGGLPSVVEFRHTSWMNKDVWVYLRQLEAAFCCVDEPELAGLLPKQVVCTSGGLGYVRFHGRNADRWWDHQEAWERYDYLYTEDELSGWLKNIRWLAERTAKTFIFFNNHRSGQAARNGSDMQRLLDISPPAAGQEQLSLF